MPLTIHTDPGQFRMDEDGAIRAGNTRVRLDTLVGQINQGETPERIVENFPTLALADIHSALAYYLRHRAEVDAYVAEVERKFEEFRREHAEMFSLEHKFRAMRQARGSSWLDVKGTSCR
jgi:uncharacterized protein (DUF433 family)